MPLLSSKYLTCQAYFLFLSFEWSHFFSLEKGIFWKYTINSGFFMPDKATASFFLLSQHNRQGHPFNPSLKYNLNTYLHTLWKESNLKAIFYKMSILIKVYLPLLGNLVVFMATCFDHDQFNLSLLGHGCGILESLKSFKPDFQFSSFLRFFFKIWLSDEKYHIIKIKQVFFDHQKKMSQTVWTKNLNLKFIFSALKVLKGN